MLIRVIPLYKGHQIHRCGGHRVTMKAKKLKKHPAKMTSAELAEHVFHPKLLKAAREQIDKANSPKKPVKSEK